MGLLKRLQHRFRRIPLILLMAMSFAALANAQKIETGSRIPIAASPGGTAGAGANLSSHAYLQGAHEAPALLKAAGVACTVTQAAYIGSSTIKGALGQKTGTADVYEAACAEGLGYFVEQQKGVQPVAFDCIEASQSGKLACMLPKNRHPANGLEAYLDAAGVKCPILRTRFVTQDVKLKLRRYEVACTAGGGYILDLALADGSGNPPVATDCLQAADLCTFTPHVESVAMLANRIGKALGGACQISDGRYVGYVAAARSDLYELSCQKNHEGLLVELDQAGALRQSLPCGQIKLVGAKCQLRPGSTVDPLIAHAQSSGASPPMIVTNPDWMSRPSGAEFVNLYPQEAIVRHLAGQATLTCRTTATGLLQDCFIFDESPAGLGFGDAALKMSSKFRLRPGTEDGRPISGQHVTIPINFGLGG